MGRAGQAEKRKIVGVIGSSDPLLPAQRVAPFEVGKWIAEQGHHLLTGGGPGVMEAASDGFCSVDRHGVAIGIIPAGRPPERYPNKWVELPIFTHLLGKDPHGPDSRNQINVRSCEALVAFAGGGGTRAELDLALEPPRGLRRKIVACVRNGETIGDLDPVALDAMGIDVAETAESVIRFLSDALRA